MKPSRLIPIAMGAMLSACSTSVPDGARTVADQAKIYPDYSGVTVPRNIAPLNFSILDDADEYVSHIHLKGQKGIVVPGATVDIPADRWSQLLSQAEGDTVLIDVFARTADTWLRHPSLKIAVAEEIDPYISYRQIEPSYIGFEVMRICQRHLESFDEREIFNNCSMAEDNNGQCINCHSYQAYNRQGNMQMHIRLNNGGTLIAHNGELKKINLKTDQTVSAGVYPSWHPTLPLIAYSNNTTTQNFHSANRNKVEVQDGASDIILYNVEKDKIQIIANDSTELETFPYWSADGKSLYYVSATVPCLSDSMMSVYKKSCYKDFKYDIYRKPFDADKMAFGATDTIFSASAIGQSATFPRESPDGRFLLFTMGEYGTFHIWHHDADLYLMDLATREVRPLDEVNSPDVESYHSFSSNGRWILFSSRRDDGSYTRLYIAYFDKDGRARKPFLLPQRDPDQNLQLFKSYNIPEFMAEPVKYTKRELMEAIASPARQVELD
ncbi:MAG: hypothetical protein LIP03_09855 [Bacteroidales bacterium]|nr:hypothetical protein [Bacteroidales bacterium]